MTAPQHITPEQRRELEAIYRQQIGAIKALARLLGYPCPIASRAERRTIVQDLDDCGTLDPIVAYPSQR
jgi:hypothetical protein